ncbi:hypothetical protein JHK86_016361 [Glycine max]|nr:hypothetical protein JHK86_016361 [Glycine max]
MNMMRVLQEHNRSFINWFRKTIFGINTASKTLTMLAVGPNLNVLTWKGYDINNYSFYTKSQDDHSVVQNSGVTIDAHSDHFSSAVDNHPIRASMPYYGQIKEIWELDYGEFRVPVFKCQWVNGNAGVRQDKMGFTLVDLQRIGYKDEPFILAAQARQVFYVEDPNDSRWSVVLQGKTIGISPDIDASTLDVNDMPTFSTEMPPVNDENEEDDDSDLNVRKPVEHSSDAKLAGESDPLGELMKILFYVYQNPVEVSWEANQFGLPEIGAKFYITHADLAEIISGDKCLNIAILQLWTIFMNECGRSKADQSLYGLLEPQSIQNAKERRQQCQQYIETWVKESQRQLYLGAYLNQAHWQLFVLHPRENTIVWFCSLRKKPDINIKGAINSAMKTITSSFEGMSNQGAPRWVEPKTNVQSGGFECGYYVMHWMWCIVTAGLKDDWHKVNIMHGVTIVTLVNIC